MQGYTTIKQYASYEYEDRKSVFIGEAMPVSCEADALSFIESVKRKYPDARHHVYAYVLRENSIMRFSDDREPQGTAGMPVLDSIRKNGCTDTVIVVTRYFGGTLLGTGGLVRAYSAAATGALTLGEIINYDIYTRAALTLSYSDYQRVTPILSELSARIEDTEYGADVTVLFRLPSVGYGRLCEKITEATSSRAKIEFLEEKFDF